MKRWTCSYCHTDVAQSQVWEWWGNHPQGKAHPDIRVLCTHCAIDEGAIFRTDGIVAFRQETPNARLLRRRYHRRK